MESDTGGPVWHSESPARRPALIAALELEARVVRAALGDASPPVYVSGPGRERAHAAALRALADGAGALVAWGLAGGLAPPAATGVVMLPHRVARDGCEWLVDGDWHRRLVASLGRQFDICEAALYSADHVIASPREKAAIGRRTGAVAVDLETAGIAEAAVAAQVPFVAIRVIADGPDDALPERVAALVTEDGRTRFGALPAFILFPRRLRRLLRLARASRRARETLRRVAGRLAEAAP